MISNIKNSRGFSLVETLVAVTILLVAVLVPMHIASQSIKTAAFSREQLVAVSLAQEGVETIVRLRDNDALDGGPTWDWYDNLPAACKAAAGCSYDGGTDTYVDCNTIANCRLYLDDAATDGEYYTHESSGLVDSGFTRQIRVSEVVADSEVLITSTVSWDSGILDGDTVSITTRTEVFNQYE